MAFTPVQKLSITSGMAMVLLSAVGLVSYLSTSQLVDAQDAAATTNTNIARLDRVLDGTVAAEEAISRYVVTAGAGTLTMIDSLQDDVEYALDSLGIASEDLPAQRRRLDSLGPLVGARFRDIRQAALVRDKVGRDSATRVLGDRRLSGVPARLIADMRNEESRLLGERTRVMVARTKSTRQLVIAGSIFAFLLALVALQPLRPSVERKLTERLSRTVTRVDDPEAGAS